MIKIRKYLKKLLLSLLKGAFVRNKTFSVKSLLVKTLRKLFSTQERRQLWTKLNEQVVEFMKQSGYEDQARPIAESALELARLIGEPLLVSNSLSNLATINYNSAVFFSNNAAKYGHIFNMEPIYKRAAQMHWEALIINSSWLGNDSLEVAIVAGNLANILVIMEHYDLAEMCYKEVLRIKQKELDPHHHSLVKSLNNLVMFYELRGQYDKANKLRSEGLNFAAKDTWLPKNLF
ncbi:MAG: tetratricopeptide repeat protein [Gloeotrichia echinulata CP02]|jgi:tetratricopeptide (TPR) repeat protein